MMATLWQLEFARNLTREAGITITRRNLRAEIRHLPRSQMPGNDKAQRFNLTLAQSLHASVILLEREAAIAPIKAVQIAGSAFGNSGTWLARGAIRLWLRLDRDPLTGVAKRGPSKVAKAMWGNGMAVEDRHGPAQVSLCVLACPFHEYFWHVGRSDLTPILCAWDTAWQAEVNASARPIRVDIRDTIARGGTACEFTFRKADPASVE